MIAIVVPTIREDQYKAFLNAWSKLFKKHKVHLVTVIDGEKPVVEYTDFDVPDTKDRIPLKDLMGKDSDLIYNKNDGVRNLGFYFIAKYLPEVRYIVTLDDDTRPIDDPIADHISRLESRVITSWISTINGFPRGIPYNLREESEVVLSHGAWLGVADWDAPSQLLNGNPSVEFFQGPIPKGVLYPMCGMNVAFKKKLLPYMYWAPMGHRVGIDRFADIWCGIESKKVIDRKNWAVVTGYAPIKHERASNVYKNLQKEAKGIEMNDYYGEDEYFKLYKKARKRWQKLIKSLI